MIRDYKFKDIEKYLRKDSSVGKDILNAFEQLSSAALIFSPIVFDVSIIPLLELLDVKNKLFEVGHKIYDYIAQKIETNYIDRIEQIQAAYALICYTAYFDTLQNDLPKNVRKKLKLTLEEKKLMLDSATENSIKAENNSEVQCKVFYADHINSFSNIKENLNLIYDNISNSLISLIKNANIYNEEVRKEKQEYEKIVDILKTLPSRALIAYEAQYLKLSDQFNDFALFAQLQNFNDLKHAISRNKQAIDSLANMTKNIDVGLSNLNVVVNSISTNYAKIQAQDIVDDLKRKYIATIQEPIIDDKEIKSDREEIRLQFPKIKDAFIPQSYKCLSYQGKEMHLEDESVWKKSPIQHDLDRFFLKYLYSPDSIDYPLIILGHPGSGKSLLTKILSAQLMCNSYTVVRIPLRDVNAEDSIDVLVEDQIKKITNRPLSTQGYGGFASQFNEKPLIIILDGYDELLQAKGAIFAGYLERVRAFQQDQKAMNRPVRIIITSRITLIDKARVPTNSTILRLMEFDKQRRQAWIDIWNNINADYFRSSNIKPFALPNREKGKKNSILELAEQPLLLLMLALYDSESNELAKNDNIKRTELYDNLLRRFVRRERGRYVVGFSDKTSQEQDLIIDEEMNRLGVVAIGMYNRKGVVIRSKQLENDLNTFSANRKDNNSELHTLKESESVLGGFFFIHQSTAQDVDAHSDNSESAFEFLHNTFGEFLAADFILRHTINEVKDIYIDRKFKLAGLNNKLSQPDNFSPGWFYCLMFVPLYSRPVILEMLREHANKALERNLSMYEFDEKFTNNVFVENLHFIVQNHLKMILSTRNSPSVMRGGMVLDRDIPLLGYLSTYSLNLIILASALSRDGFEFDENQYHCTEISEQDSKPWDKLAALWKTWFSPADLSGLSVVIKAKRLSDNIVHIVCNEKFEAVRYEKPIDILLCVSSTLADNLLTGLTGVQTPRFREISRLSNKDILDLLKTESSDLYVSYLIILLRREANGVFQESRRKQATDINYKSINDLIEFILHDESIRTVGKDTLLNFLELIESCLLRKLLFYSTRKNLMKHLPLLFDDWRVGIRKRIDYPEATIISRILKLLVQSTEPIITDKRFEYQRYLRIENYGLHEFDSEAEKILYFLSKYSTKDDLLNSNNDMNLMFQTAPFKSRKFYMMDFEDDEFYHIIFSNESIEQLLQTDPEALSKLLLSALQNIKLKKTIDRGTVEFFINESLSILSYNGLNGLGYNAVINIILIAKNQRLNSYNDKIIASLQRELFERSPHYFTMLILSQPQFVIKLVDVIPELFSVFPMHMIEPLYLERKIRLLSLSQILDYIGVMHSLWTINQDFADRELREFLHFIEHIAEEVDFSKNIDYDQLTLKQCRDLIWYADTIGDSIALDKLHEYMNFREIKTMETVI